MARFLGRPLEELDELYDFRDSKVSTSELDLSAIQLVHDTSMGARVARSLQLTRRVTDVVTGGDRSADEVIYSRVLAIPGGTTQNTVFDPWSDAFSAGLTTRDAWAWFTGFALSNEASGTINPGWVAIRRQAFAATGSWEPVYKWRDEFFDVFLGTPASPAWIVGTIPSGGETWAPTGRIRPIRLRASGPLVDDRDLVYVGGQSNPAASLSIQARFLFTPRGVYPSWI